MRNDRPTVSIVTPSYNQAEYLSSAIESVSKQTYDDVEHIVIDGNSDDGSVDVLRSFDANLDYWVSEPDSGQSEAINKGFRRASGDLVCWLNADDVLFPTAVERIVDTYGTRPEADILTANAVYIDADGKVVRCLRVPEMDWWFFNRGVGFFLAPAIFFQADTLEEVGYLDPELEFSMDQDLWHRFREADAEVVHRNEYLGGFRVHENSKTGGNITGENDDYEFEMPETTEIRQRYIPDTSRRTIKLFRLLYKLRQTLNLNYVRERIDTLRWRGTDWKQVFAAK